MVAEGFTLYCFTVILPSDCWVLDWGHGLQDNSRLQVSGQVSLSDD